MEGFSWQNVAVGMFVGMLSMHLMGRFFKFEEIENVNFYKLAIYPPWLIQRIYVDAFFLLRLIIGKAKWGVMTMDLELENESLRIMLADSVTLTPGSVYLERHEKRITLLCIGHKDKKGYPASVGDVRAIEKMLVRSQVIGTTENKKDAD